MPQAVINVKHTFGHQVLDCPFLIFTSCMNVGLIYGHLEVVVQLILSIGVIKHFASKEATHTTTFTSFEFSRENTLQRVNVFS